jgi:hypothetical protein
MKAALIGFAGLALAGFAAIAPAQAQGAPPGSYLQTCTDVHMEPGRVVALCRRMDGRMNRTALADPQRCRGGIDNNNGNLQCAGGGPGPGYGERRDERDRGEVRERGEGRQRCEDLRREGADLRRRLEREYNPLDRQRLEQRLREVREQEDRCR